MAFDLWLAGLGWATAGLPPRPPPGIHCWGPATTRLEYLTGLGLLLGRAPAPAGSWVRGTSAPMEHPIRPRYFDPVFPVRASDRAGGRRAPVHIPTPQVQSQPRPRRYGGARGLCPAPTTATISTCSRRWGSSSQKPEAPPRALRSQQGPGGQSGSPDAPTVTRAARAKTSEGLCYTAANRPLSGAIAAGCWVVSAPTLSFAPQLPGRGCSLDLACKDPLSVPTSLFLSLCLE